MKHRIVTFLTTATVVSVALSLAAATPASASPLSSSSRTTVRTAAVQLAASSSDVTDAPSTAVIEVTTSTTTLDAAATAATGCGTNTQTDELDQAPLGWPELAWFTISTSWCWNGKIVTSHSTPKIHGEATGPGSNIGWAYNGTLPHSIGVQCYIAVGSKTNCSGTDEYAQGSFSQCLVKYGCIATWQPYIDEWENYHGGKGRWS